MGSIESIFLATQEEIDEAIGCEVYFGEVLGKHSEIAGTLKKEDVTVITDNAEVVGIVRDHLSGGVGLNPLDHIEDEEEDGNE